MKYNKIYLKITTIPNQLEVDIDSKEIKIFRKKYESHKSFLKDSDVELAYLNESAVNGSFAKIYSITLGFIQDSQVIVKTIYGDEKLLLDKLLAILRLDGFQESTVVMYNRSFILSFISKRLRWHKYSISSLPISLNQYNKKAWTIKGSKCIQEYVKGIGYQTENFEETCYIHGIDTNLVEGSDVARLVKKQNFDILHTSDIAYVYALMRVDNELSEEPALGELNGIAEQVGEVEKQEVNVLEHIISSGQLSQRIIESIVKFAEENDLDRENVLTLVKAALSKTKEYQKVEEGDVADLKDRLGLTVDYSMIQEVVTKGNLGKKEADSLVKRYKDSDQATRQEVLSLVEQFLTENKKIGQKRAKEALEFLKTQLK